jgi:glycosyltransferase involved in cell wall biosynthesis
MPRPEVSVVVPCHAAAATLPRLLDALREQTLSSELYEVIVVDTGADGTWKLLERIGQGWDGPRLELVRGPVRDGPGAKRNVGAGVARGRLLAFTDADCAPDPGWLAAGLHAADEGAEIVQGSTLMPEGERHNTFAHWIIITKDSGLHETCNIFYGADAFRSAGGFDTHYYRRYGRPFGEDADLGWRVRRAGARYRFEPDAVVRHPVGPASMRGHLREQWLARGFPELAGDVPELRDTLFYRRLFLSERTALFAAAVAGAALTPKLRPAALLAVPYLRRLLRGPEPARYLASDTMLAAGLWYGSVRSRHPVL